MLFQLAPTGELIKTRYSVTVPAEDVDRRELARSLQTTPLAVDGFDTAYFQLGKGSVMMVSSEDSARTVNSARTVDLPHPPSKFDDVQILADLVPDGDSVLLLLVEGKNEAGPETLAVDPGAFTLQDPEKRLFSFFPATGEYALLYQGREFKNLVGRRSEGSLLEASYGDKHIVVKGFNHLLQ